MKDIHDINLDIHSELSANEAKKIKNKDAELSDITPPSSGSDKPRVKACINKKYGSGCVWTDNNGVMQTGICIYDKWGIANGELFCAKKDYKGEDFQENIDQ